MLKKVKQPTDTIISIILIVQNDADIIVKILRDIIKKLYEIKYIEILIIDNGSTDGTGQVIRKLQKEISQVRIIILSKKCDTEIALTAGFDNAVGDYVVTYNLYTDSPALIFLILQELYNGYNVVLTSYESYDILFKDFISSKIVSFFSRVYKKNFLSHINYSAGFTRKAINSITKVRRKKRFMRYINDFVGYTSKTIVYQPHSKYLGKIEKVKLLRLLFRSLDASISHSVRPLRLASSLSIIAALLDIIFLMYVFTVTLIKKNIAEGWITTSVIIGTMFFVLFCLLAVISEYILRILDESRQEPLYFI